MDSGDMRELLVGYLNEIDWSGGASKDEIVGALAERDTDLLTMVNQYITEGMYENPGAVLNLIPEQAWQASQGDDWRGATTEDPEAFDSNFTESPVGQMEQNDVYHQGGPQPKTPGFGEIAADQQSVQAAQGAGGQGSSSGQGGSGGQGSASGQGGVGGQGSNAGEVDPGVSGRSETTGNAAQ